MWKLELYEFWAIWPVSVDTHWRNNDGKWPPNSPDLNPLDYSVWSILEEKACAKPPPECGILEASFEEGMERNHLGNFDQDRGQLSEATEGLHGCKRRTFWINLVVVIVICCILNKFVEKMLLKRKKIWTYALRPSPNLGGGRSA